VRLGGGGLGTNFVSHLQFGDTHNLTLYKTKGSK